MKLIYFLLLITLSACNTNENNNRTNAKKDSLRQNLDSFPELKSEKQSEDEEANVETFSNERFREVRVVKSGDNTYRITGEAQIFEANFSWVVEDGHNEIKEGFQMTDAGAPEWGKFDFTVEVQKERENSTLTLILFESSPKDGSRQHELPIVLE